MGCMGWDPAYIINMLTRRWCGGGGRHFTTVMDGWCYRVLSLRID